MPTSPAPSTDVRRALHLHLLGAAETADGSRLLSTEGVSAWLVDDGSLRLTMALRSGSRAESRWEAWQVVRRLRGLYPISSWSISASAAVDDDTVTTLALDLHNASAGSVQVQGRPAVAEEVARIGAAEERYRSWINEEPTTRTSIQIAADVQAFADSRADVQAEILAEEQLEQLGMNLLLAVGGASAISPPRLVTARYDPPGATGAPLMLLGKGITFDTGGINVKPYESFVSMMKNDMGGAALAWSLFVAMVEAGHPWPLVVVLPTCENPIGENATRPGSIVKSYRGHRVRIDHTDAEGRLVMADGLTWATEKHDPRMVFTFATLTTAALIAYGPHATPIHFAPPELQTRLEKASDRRGEDLHFFPFRAWHREANRDLEADIKNTGRLPGHASRGAGSRNAAHFLRFFTDSPLVHADIFASTWNWSADAPGSGYGATGSPLRTLLTALEDVPGHGKTAP